jgi:hypothetical protein
MIMFRCLLYLFHLTRSLSEMSFYVVACVLQAFYPDDTANLADCSVHGSSRKFLNVDPNTQLYMLYSCFSTDIYGSVITTSSMLSYRPDPLRLLTNNFHEQQIEK